MVMHNDTVKQAGLPLVKGAGSTARKENARSKGRQGAPNDSHCEVTFAERQVESGTDNKIYLESRVCFKLFVSEVVLLPIYSNKFCL